MNNLLRLAIQSHSCFGHSLNDGQTVRMRLKLLLMCLVLGPSRSYGQSMVQYEEHENKLLSSKFYRREVNTGKNIPMMHCASLCNVEPDCQAFYMDPICHLIIHDYMLHKVFLQSPGDKTFYLAVNMDRTNQSCVIINGDVQNTNLNLEMITTANVEECLQTCYQWSGK